MLEVRIQALGLCFVTKNGEEIKQFIARFSSCDMGVDGEENNGGQTPARVEIGNCPPCELYAKLRPVSDLFDLIEKYHACTQPKHLRDCRVLLKCLHACSNVK